MLNGNSSGSPTHECPSSQGSRRSSISDINAMEKHRRSRSVSSTPQKPRLPHYERSFPPFFVQSHTVLAPQNRFVRDRESSGFSIKIDESLKEDKKFIIKPLNPYRLLHISPYRSKRFQVHTVYNVIAKIHAPTRNSTDKPTDLLKRIPVKYLKFAEDVRPPYVGTYTKLKDDQAISKLSRNPFSRGLPKTDYDYDSEAEWEEPGEGEDLDSEGEESEDEEEDEMEGFLDDEETDAIGAIKRRPILGNLEPTSTGPCWEGLDTSKMGEVGDLALTRYKLDILMGKHTESHYHTLPNSAENPQLPIDPYSSEYWETITSTSSINASPRTQSTLMEPPRIPLNPINRQNTLLNSSVPVKGPKIAVSGATVPMKPPKAPKRFIPQELMEEFKQAVKGKDLNKLGLVEILKKQ